LLVKYANGWIGMIYGTLENFENTINTIRNMVRKENEQANKNGKGFKILLLTYPKFLEEDSSSPKTEDKRPPMTGTIDEIGGDLRRIKDTGVVHIIFGYSFLPIGRDMDKMIDTTKQLRKYCS
jgi:hypothetical protein